MSLCNQPEWIREVWLFLFLMLWNLKIPAVPGRVCHLPSSAVKGICSMTTGKGNLDCKVQAQTWANTRSYFWSLLCTWTSWRKGHLCIQPGQSQVTEVRNWPHLPSLPSDPSDAWLHTQASTRPRSEFKSPLCHRRAMGSWTKRLSITQTSGSSLVKLWSCPHPSKSSLRTSPKPRRGLYKSLSHVISHYLWGTVIIFMSKEGEC